MDKRKKDKITTTAPMIKKTNKIPRSEIEKAERLREKYLAVALNFWKECIF